MRPTFPILSLLILNSEVCLWEIARGAIEPIAVFQMAPTFSPLTQTYHPTVSVDQKPGLCLAWSLSQVSDWGISCTSSLPRIFLRQDPFPGSLSCWQGLVPYGLLSWEPQYIADCWMMPALISLPCVSHYSAVHNMAAGFIKVSKRGCKRVPARRNHRFLYFSLRNVILAFWLYPTWILLVGNYSVGLTPFL